MLPWRERSKLQIRQAHAFHFLDRMARLEKPVAERVPTRFRSSGFVPRRILPTAARDAHSDRARKLFHLLEREQRLDLNVVRLRQVVRLQDEVGQFAVVREENQARGMVFEPPYRKHALRHTMQEIA